MFIKCGSYRVHTYSLIKMKWPDGTKTLNKTLHPEWGGVTGSDQIRIDRWTRYCGVRVVFTRNRNTLYKKADWDIFVSTSKNSETSWMRKKWSLDFWSFSTSIFSGSWESDLEGVPDLLTDITSLEFTGRYPITLTALQTIATNRIEIIKMPENDLMEVGRVIKSQVNV